MSPCVSSFAVGIEFIKVVNRMDGIAKNILGVVAIFLTAGGADFN